ncbi:MAG: pyridoxal-phosphate dependent enzyme [Rhodospirillaceae bacterium]
MTAFPTLEDVEAAAERIKNQVRRTPCLRTRFVREAVHPNLMLKLECLQVTGSFKARGASNAVMALDDAARARGVITASGGNHGTAVAYAGNRAGARTVVYLPERADKAKIGELEAWGAEVVVTGDVWDDANAAALARAEAEGRTYIHPFANPDVIAGQGTVAREMLRQSEGIDVIVVGIGGGGLISGIATAAKAIKPDVRVIGVEPVGAPTLRTSLDAGRLTTLDAIATEAVTLAPKRSAEINLDIIGRLVDDVVLVDDDAMRRAARWLFAEMGIAAELSGAAALAALQVGAVTVPDDATVCAVVCGRGRDGIG